MRSSRQSSQGMCLNFYAGRANGVLALIRTKRVYEPPSPEDGYRILVDRLWPRGLSKESAMIDLWLKEIAPSDALRKWFAHDPKKWPEFKRRFEKEMDKKEEAVSTLKRIEKEKRKITLVYGARDQEHNNAEFLRDFLQR